MREGLVFNKQGLPVQVTVTGNLEVEVPDLETRRDVIALRLKVDEQGTVSRMFAASRVGKLKAARPERKDELNAQ